MGPAVVRRGAHRHIREAAGYNPDLDTSKPVVGYFLRAISPAATRAQRCSGLLRTEKKSQIVPLANNKFPTEQRRGFFFLFLLVTLLKSLPQVS